MSDLKINNQKLTKEELARIRALPDFDLTMFLSELHDNGMSHAMRLLPSIEEAVAQAGGRTDKPIKRKMQ